MAEPDRRSAFIRRLEELATTAYAGQHVAIVDRALFVRVEAQIGQGWVERQFQSHAARAASLRARLGARMVSPWLASSTKPRSSARSRTVASHTSKRATLSPVASNLRNVGKPAAKAIGADSREAEFGWRVNVFRMVGACARCSHR